jgi:hypothetical protein
MKVSIHYVIYGLLIGAIMALSAWTYYTNKLNAVYLHTMEQMKVDVGQYHRVQDGMLYAIKSLAENDRDGKK